jgi:hypothetical protein
MEERAKTFTERGKRQPDWVFVSVLRFAQAQKERVVNGEISPATLGNYIKAIKLFCEMNDIVITWKKITRGLPKARRFADDRAPTLDEIRRIIDYPDRRIKPISVAGFRRNFLPCNSAALSLVETPAKLSPILLNAM